jgi:hypothetical protein
MKMSEEKLIKVAKGVGGAIYLYENRIKIERKGALAFVSHGLKGDKEIFLDQISAVQYRRAGWVNGYIQFTLIGGQEAKGGLLEAGGDENTVVFNVWQQKDFEELKGLIDKKLAEIRAKKNVVEAKKSPLEELEILAKLRKDGILSEEEFEEKKKRILEKI